MPEKLPRTPYDYQLQYSKEAGLIKSKTDISVVRTNHLLNVIGDTACVKLSDLSRTDWINVPIGVITSIKEWFPMMEKKGVY